VYFRRVAAEVEWIFNELTIRTALVLRRSMNGVLAYDGAGMTTCFEQKTDTLSSGTGLASTERRASGKVPTQSDLLLKPRLPTVLSHPSFLSFLVAHTVGLQEEGRQENTGGDENKSFSPHILQCVPGASAFSGKHNPLTKRLRSGDPPLSTLWLDSCGAPSLNSLPQISYFKLNAFSGTLITSTLMNVYDNVECPEDG